MKIKISNKKTTDTIEVSIRSWLAYWIMVWFKPDKADLIKPFHSNSYEYDFSRMSEYYMEIGRRNTLLEHIVQKSSQGQPAIGYSHAETFTKIARLLAGTSCCVIMSNIPYEAVGKLRDRFPTLDPNLFLEDIVFIPVKNRLSVEKLTHAFNPDMCLVHGFDGGELIATNYVL